MDTEDTSGYSSLKSSPQSSDENFFKRLQWGKIRLELKTPEFLKESSELEIEKNEKSGIQKCGENEGENEEKCEFRPVVTPNEIDSHKEWYHRLLMLKLEYKRGERGAFPPFPPPPLPSMMIAASNAVSFNAFDEVKRAAQAKTAKSPSTSSLERRAQRFCPADFQPLPPPHIYIEMIRTLAPHQYIDLTYALAGSVLLEMGVKIPDRYPNLPPKIEPYRDIESEEAAHWTEMSSQSSSEGEYSDASESAKLVQTLNRRKNKERRETRKIRIVASMLTSSTFSMKKKRKNEGLDFKHETFPRDYDYKEKTLSTFIPPRIARRPPIPPPQFFFPPSPHFSREPHSLPPMPMMLPIPLPPMSLSSPISPIHFQKNLQSTPERPSRTDSSRVHAKQIKNDIIIVEKVTDV